MTSTGRMSGKLKEVQMDHLEQWIGGGPKKFDLLYAITRDGCDPNVFHQKCDNQGPTVTILYDQKESIYGGYTSVSWHQNNNWEADGSAFLFCLQSKGNKALCKYSSRNPTDHAVACDRNHGPWFKGLETFKGKIDVNAGHYSLNGNTSGWNESYNCLGVSADDFTDGSLIVTELEVYKLTDGQRSKPAVLETFWRENIEWNAKSLEDLKSEAQNFSPPHEAHILQSRILVMGPVGSGKSSFFNTIASIFRCRVARQAPSGSAENSITSQFRSYEVIDFSSRRPLNFRLCDTRGLEENQDKDTNDIMFLLDGNVPEGYQFNASVPISPEILGFKRNTTLKEKIHCVCLVIDGSTAGVLSEKFLKKIKDMQSKIYLKGVPQMILLTKIDKVCHIVEKDVSQVFRSSAILEQVEKVSQLFGVPRHNVLPIKNYEKEMKLDENVNILALIGLLEILRASEDFLYNNIEVGVATCEHDSDNAPKD